VNSNFVAFETATSSGPPENCTQSCYIGKGRLQNVTRVQIIVPNVFWRKHVFHNVISPHNFNSFTSMKGELFAIFLNKISKGLMHLFIFTANHFYQGGK